MKAKAKTKMKTKTKMKMKTKTKIKNPLKTKNNPFSFSFSFFFFFCFYFCFSFSFFFYFYSFYFINFTMAPLSHHSALQKDVFQKRSKFNGGHSCRSVISIKLHSKNFSINMQFWEYSTGLDDINIKVITMVLTTVMLVIIYRDWFYY